jgi:hypothetical protein
MLGQRYRVDPCGLLGIHRKDFMSFLEQSPKATVDLLTMLVVWLRPSAVTTVRTALLGMHRRIERDGRISRRRGSYCGYGGKPISVVPCYRHSHFSTVPTPLRWRG